MPAAARSCRASSPRGGSPTPTRGSRRPSSSPRSPGPAWPARSSPGRAKRHSASASPAAGQLFFVSQLLRLPECIRCPGPSRAAGTACSGLPLRAQSPVYLGAITLDLFAVLLGGATALPPDLREGRLAGRARRPRLLRGRRPWARRLMALLQTRLPPVAASGPGVAPPPSPASVWPRGPRSVGATSCSRWRACSPRRCGDSISVVIRLTLEQVITPDALRGRVSAISRCSSASRTSSGPFESGATRRCSAPSRRWWAAASACCSWWARDPPRLAGALADRAAAQRCGRLAV